MSNRTPWRTNARTGRAHLVADRKPACGAPTPQGGVTWSKTTRGHQRCPDCLRLEAGASMADLALERAHASALEENAHRDLNA